MIKVRRMIGIMAATAMAGALPVLLASPAHATSGDCTNYMHNLGYLVGPKVISACDWGAKQGLMGSIGQSTCQAYLAQAGVSNSGHRSEACYQASRRA